MGDELAIAAVEKAGGRFTASYYDRGSIQAAVNPVDYFLKGEPVRKRQLPPGTCSHILSILIRIPTVKLKIPGKAFFKSESRNSVTFKL